jgi:hypothetical protein
MALETGGIVRNNQILEETQTIRDQTRADLITAITYTNTIRAQQHAEYRSMRNWLAGAAIAAILITVLLIVL